MKAIHWGVNSCVRRTRVQHNAGKAIYRNYSAPLTAKIDVKKLIESSPAWDIDELVPQSSDQGHAISREQLHHLHRLCALNPPSDEAEEQRLIADLSSQLHFVREIQKVDTTGVEPLCSLRDETKAGREEATIGLDQLKDALAKEQIRGVYNTKIRRQAGQEKPAEIEWDPLSQATKKVGRYFVVDSPTKG